jgi:hypothetical protein
MQAIFTVLTTLGLMSSVALASPMNWHEWHHKDGSQPKWLIADDQIEIQPGSGDIFSDAEYGDFELSVDFFIPNLGVDRVGQDRGNSGIYIHGIYELQILDSIDNPVAPSTGCGSLYKFADPLVETNCAPEVWHSYRINFQAPRLDDAGKPLSFAMISVWLDGVLIHDRVTMSTGTGSARKMPILSTGPIRLQEHGSPVRFRRLVIAPAI